MADGGALGTTPRWRDIRGVPDVPEASSEVGEFLMDEPATGLPTAERNSSRGPNCSADAL